MHSIMYKPDNTTVIISQNSYTYTEYIMSNWISVFNGSKKECLEFLETIESINN